MMMENYDLIISRTNSGSWSFIQGAGLTEGVDWNTGFHHDDSTDNDNFNDDSNLNSNDNSYDNSNDNSSDNSNDTDDSNNDDHDDWDVLNYAFDYDGKWQMPSAYLSFINEF